MSKLPTEINSDAKRAIALAFEGAGGLQKLTNWARTHPMEFYTQVYIKLLPYTVEAKIDATIHDAEQARAKLQDAFQRLIASRASGDTRDARTIEHDPQPRLEQPVADHEREPSLPRSIPRPVTPDNVPQPLAAATSPPTDTAAEGRRRAMQSSYRPPIMNTGAAEMTATQLFYEWCGNRSSDRISPKDWGPV
jgi:hypothetical protein